MTLARRDYSFCCMCNLDTNYLKALIFDVAGTLYQWRLVRYGMLWRLLTF
jgi:hypothetical protein